MANELRRAKHARTRTCQCVCPDVAGGDIHRSRRNRQGKWREGVGERAVGRKRVRKGAPPQHSCKGRRGEDWKSEAVGGEIVGGELAVV